MSTAATPMPQEPEPRKRRRKWHPSLRLTALCLLALFGLGAGVGFVVGRPIAVPDWMQLRIEARIAQEMPDARVSFGEMVFLLDKSLEPHVRLRDVTVANLFGQEIISLTEFNATFATAPLLSGVAQPKHVSLSGLFLTLTRNEDGAMSLSGTGGTAPPSRRAANLPQLISQYDQLLTSPSLNALENVELRALTLRYRDRLADRAWTVDGGRLRLTRAQDVLTLAADLAVLGGGAGVATLAANYTSRIGETAAEFGVRIEGVPAQDIATQGAAFAWLDVLRAPISGAVRGGLDEGGTIAPISATLQIGAGAVQPNAQTRPIPFDGARSYFSYDPEQQLLRFDELSVQSQWISGLASGTATLNGLGEGGAFGDLVGQFQVLDLIANPAELYPEPVELAKTELDFQLKLNPFRLKLGRLQISDDGKILQLSGGLWADPAGWRVALDAQMDALTPKRLLALWPETLKPKTRTWLVENIQAGLARNIDAAFRLAPEGKPQVFVAFDFEDARARFLKTMPPAKDGRGHFSLSENRLVVSLDQGHVTAPEGGDVDVQGTSFIIPDVAVKGGPPAVIRLNTRSSVTAVLSLINQEPLRVMDKAKMPVTLAQGQARVQGTLAIPLRKGAKTDEAQYHFEADLRNLRSDVLVKDRSLTAERFRARVDNTNVTLDGKGRIDGVAFDGAWSQPIGPGSEQSTLRGEVALDQKALDTFGIALPRGTVSGAGTGRVALDFKRGAAPRFALGSDLRGLRISVPQVSWSKPASREGRLQISGSLGDVPKVDSLAVSAAGLSAKGSVTLRPSGALDRVRFSQLKVGDWLDVPVDLIGQGNGKAVQVAVRGGRLDMRKAAFGSSSDSSGAPASPPMSINLDRLQITDTIALTGMNGQFDTNKGLDGAFDAQINGGTAVQGRVIPQNGRSAIRITSKDAGGVVRSAGLLNQVVGGALELLLLPVGSGDAFDGRVTAEGVRIKGAPGIAGLVNAISVVGLINELNGDGIFFNTVEGDFRLTSNRLTLSKSSAVGASMGLSMDGIYNLNSGLINMRGVISPVYLLNGIGSILTRKGEGVIGFNYRLTGPAKEPKVSVNPLSALTPAMFRDLFRAAPPELQDVEGVTDSVLPDAVPRGSDKPVVERFEGR